LKKTEPLRVLLVDDEEDLVFTMEERLKIRGFDAEGFVSGESALERFKEKEFDVVVIDVKMPGLGGLEAMRKMKAIRPDVAVIFFTGHGSQENGEEGMREGAFDYLMKPVNLEDLIVKIKQAAEKPPERNQDG